MSVVPVSPLRALEAGGSGQVRRKTLLNRERWLNVYPASKVCKLGIKRDSGPQDRHLSDVSAR
jgi:hypothetical protein